MRLRAINIDGHSLSSDNMSCKVSYLPLNFSKEERRKILRQGSPQGVPDPMCMSRYSEDNQKA